MCPQSVHVYNFTTLPHCVQVDKKPNETFAFIKKGVIMAGIRGVAQPGRVLGLGPRCRRFEPSHPDHVNKKHHKRGVFYRDFCSVESIILVLVHNNDINLSNSASFFFGLSNQHQRSLPSDGTNSYE